MDEHFAEGAMMEGTPAGNTPDVNPTDPSTQGAAAPQDFEPKQYGYKYKGQEFYPKDRQHMMNLISRGHMSGALTGQWNQERSQLQQQMEEMKSKYGRYDDLDQWAQSNPQQWQTILSQMEGGQQGDQQATLPPEVQSKLEKVEELEKWQQEQVVKEHTQRFNSDMQKLREQYADGFDWQTDEGEGNLEQRVFRNMQETGNHDVASAFRNMHFDQIMSQQQAKAKEDAAEKLQESKRAGYVVDKQPVGSQPQQKVDTSKLSMDQIAEWAKNNVRNK